MPGTDSKPLLGELDRHLWNEGRHWTIYDVLGAHIEERGGAAGVRFAVWAPNASAVSVLGDFNGILGWEFPAPSVRFPL